MHWRMFLLMVMIGSRVLGASPESGFAILRHSFVGDSIFSFGIRPHDKEWFDIEVTTNLTNWTTLASAISTNATTFFADDEVSRAGRRIYRLKSPGGRPADQRAHWTARNLRGYRMTVTLTRLSDGSLVTAEVAVRGGEKSVTNVMNAVTGEAITDFKVEDFPAVEELFAMIEGLAAPGIYDLRVWYDPMDAFPRRIEYRKPPAVGQVRVNRFEVVPPPLEGPQQNSTAPR